MFLVLLFPSTCAGKLELPSFCFPGDEMTLPIPTVCSWIQEGGDSNYGPQRPAALREICCDKSLAIVGSGEAWFDISYLIRVAISLAPASK